MGHDDKEHSCSDHSNEKALKIGIILTSAYFVVELVGGYLSNSLALIGDAGHMLRDVIGLMLSYGAMMLAQKLPSKERTFGFHRMEILAALLNGLALVGFSAWMIWEGYHRLASPEGVESTLMLIVASIGLILNLYVATRLHKSDDVNVKSARLCVIADTVSSAGVIVAAIIIKMTGKTFVDPLLGIIIALAILYSAFGLIRETARILLEYAPKGVDFDKVIGEMKSVKGVQGVHNVHLWSLCSNIHVLDAHILAKDSTIAKTEGIKGQIRKKLDRFDIKHITLEFECMECLDKDEVRKLKH